MGQVLGVKSPADPVLSALSSGSAPRECSSKPKAAMALGILLPRECLFFPSSCPSSLPSNQDRLRSGHTGRSKRVFCRQSLVGT